MLRFCGRAATSGVELGLHETGDIKCFYCPIAVAGTGVDDLQMLLKGITSVTAVNSPKRGSLERESFDRFEIGSVSAVWMWLWFGGWCRMQGVCGGCVLLGLSAELAARGADSADLTEKNLRL
jgi:hypothetical protein